MKKKLYVMIALALSTSATVAAQAPPALLGPPATVPAAPPPNYPPPPAGPPVPVTGQSVNPPLPGPPAPVAGPSFEPPLPPLRSTAPQPQDNQGGGWVTLDYLLWWVKPGPSSSPLITTGSPVDDIPGALGQPHTRILFGRHNLDFDDLSGARLSAGWWLPCCPVIGIEGSFFVLDQGEVRFETNSDPTGHPVVARPFINASTGTESAYIDSLAGLASGGAAARATLQLNSWEINLALDLVHSRNLEWDMIIGFRSLDLIEDLEIRDVFVPLTPEALTFNGNPVDPSSSLADIDRFRTSNHFYGGQIGSRLIWCRGPWDISVVGKVALGTTQQVINVDGASLFMSSESPTGGSPGGVLAQVSNIGRIYRSSFSVIPETDLNFGVQITPWMRLQMGYTFLYWSNVVRPGNQVDRVVNPALVPTDSNFGTLTGPARPVLLPHTSDFWTQGVNFGLVFSF